MDSITAARGPNSPSCDGEEASKHAARKRPAACREEVGGMEMGRGVSIPLDSLKFPRRPLGCPAL